MLYGQLRKNLGEVFHELARQKESKVLEGHSRPDHVYMLILIPPKYSVFQVIGYMKGKSAIHMSLLQKDVQITQNTSRQKITC
jgi:putative transposase